MVAPTLIGTFNRIWQDESLSFCVVCTDYTTECKFLAEFSLETGAKTKLQFDGRLLMWAERIIIAN